jgi:hypothetical protein
MVPRRHRIALWAFSVVVVLWTVGEMVARFETGLLFVAPALVLALPLILGRYVGEDQIAELARRPATAWCRAPIAEPVPRSFVRVMQRGGRLVGSALAKRPPPAVARVPTT